MNKNILLPRRKRNYPNFLVRMARHIFNGLVRFIRCVGNYRYYRKKGICRSIAWAQARGTL